MADKKFLMLSLEDAATKKIANVVSNDTCKKLLDALSEKDCAESELSKKLNLPISTVHYNLKQLVDVGLVSADEFHYSKKGKEMLHYKLANKYIIITPKAVTGIKEKLRKILPVALISAGAAGVAQIIYNALYPIPPFAGAPIASSMGFSQESSIAQKSAAPMMDTFASSAQNGAIDSSSYSLSSFPIDIALWFFAGALFGTLIYMLLASLRKE